MAYLINLQQVDYVLLAIATCAFRFRVCHYCKSHSTEDLAPMVFVIIAAACTTINMPYQALV